MTDQTEKGNESVILKREQLEKRVMFAPIFKSTDGGYVAVLSHTAIDRDDEIVGKKFMDRAADKKYLPALMDHENKALGLVGKWTNMQVRKDGDEYMLVGEPKFFLSNPAAVTIKGMLDDGAEMGVSITAIPNSYEYVEKGGQRYKMWTDGEIVSADFVGIQSQKHATARNVLAKHFIMKETEVSTMNEEEKIALKKDFTESLEKSLSDVTAKVATLEKANEDLKKELASNKELLEKMSTKEAEREKVLAELNKNVKPSADPELTQPDAGQPDDVSANAFIKMIARGKQ